MVTQYHGSKRVFAGLDLGQRRDHSALVALEWEAVNGELDRELYLPRAVIRKRVRHIQRFPLGMPYTEQAAEVRLALASMGEVSKLVVDATGVGAPVVETLRQYKQGYRVVPVTITGGGAAQEFRGNWSVPKADLIGGLQVTLEKGTLEIAARCEGADALVSELGDMRGKQTRGGQNTWGVWQEGKHDDLVLALALAVWAMQKEVGWADDGEWLSYFGQLMRKEWGGTQPRLWY